MLPPSPRTHVVVAKRYLQGRGGGEYERAVDEKSGKNIRQEGEYRRGQDRINEGLSGILDVFNVDCDGKYLLIEYLAVFRGIRIL